MESLISELNIHWDELLCLPQEHLANKVPSQDTILPVSLRELLELAIRQERLLRHDINILVDLINSMLVHLHLVSGIHFCWNLVFHLCILVLRWSAWRFALMDNLGVNWRLLSYHWRGDLGLFFSNLGLWDNQRCLRFLDLNFFIFNFLFRILLFFFVIIFESIHIKVLIINIIFRLNFFILFLFIYFFFSDLGSCLDRSLALLLIWIIFLENADIAAGVQDS